jgi:fatty-acyl-CoA synthase
VPSAEPTTNPGAPTPPPVGPGVPGTDLPTIAGLVLAHRDDDHVAVLFEDESLTYREWVQGCVERAHLLLAVRDPERPFHVGVLADNVPEYTLLLGAVALAGGALVGINPTRQGAELERDIRHADCQIIVSEQRHLPTLAGLDLGVPEDRTFVVGTAAWDAALAPHQGAEPPDVEIDPLAPYLLLFTSGTTGSPKAAICSQARLARIGPHIVSAQGLTADDVCYLVMPMFHSNALMAGWVGCLTAGATAALRRKFSASGFLPDVRRFGVTFFNYVGKPLTYILATPEQPDDADNPLTRAFGNEGAPHDLDRFAQRFGCRVQDSYGSTEGGATVQRVPGMPPGSLGMGPEGTVILDPETLQEKPRAVFDEHGRLTNADECVGEIANLTSASSFEGYWNNPEAVEERTHHGIYWSGDLGYRDADGWFYFAGRNYDWLRVDGENFAAAPIETILCRHPAVALAAVYAVPNAEVGDDVMAAVALRPGAEVSGSELMAFLEAQGDLGTKWKPRYVRLADELPQTQTNKILKRELRGERWECADPVLVRDGDGYRLLTDDDRAEIRARFAERDRLAVLDA